MKYHSVADTAKLWNISERTVRNYCATGKIPGAVLTGKTWNIPQDAKRPERTNKKPEAPRTLLDVLQNEMTGQVKGGIYHKIQIDLTYNSNHIEGSRLTHDQTRYIYETNTIGMEKFTAWFGQYLSEQYDLTAAHSDAVTAEWQRCAEFVAHMLPICEQKTPGDGGNYNEFSPEFSAWR